METILELNVTSFASHEVLQQGKLYGFEMAFVGDVNGDGYDDVIISEVIRINYALQFR